MGQIITVTNKSTLVKQAPLFSKLNWFDTGFVVNGCSLWEYKKGEIIYNEADPPDAFYCLISGRLEAYTSQEDTKKETLEYLYRGKHFGIISLLTGDSHSVTIKAVNDSIVLKIEKDYFQRILKRIPSLAIDLGNSISRRIKRRELHRKTIFESTIISVYSSTVGTGGSTYAINLALSLKDETKRKVVLININSSAQNVLGGLEVSKDLPTVNLENITYDNTKVIQNILSREWGIDLLSVAYNPASRLETNQISQLLSFLSNDYHYIVIDLPNEMDDIVFKGLVQSDLVHFVSLQQKSNLNTIDELILRLKNKLKDNFRQEKVKVILRQDVDSKLKPPDSSGLLNSDVYATLPSLPDKARETKEIIVTILEPQSEYAKAVRRISREISGNLVGLALGGGAALGLAHIGVLKILEEKNIPIDVVAGSSMGAIIAALWASGKTIKEVESIAKRFKSNLSSFKLLDITLPIPISGLLRGRSLDKLLRKILGKKTFRDLARSLAIVSYDLKNRQEIVIDKGSLVDAVKASSAIPGVFKPILREGMMLIDGGVLNPVPTNVLASMGIKKIIAVNVLSSPEDVVRSFQQSQAHFEEERKIPFNRSPLRYLKFRIKNMLRKIFLPNIFDVIVNSFQASEYFLAQEACRNADIVIHPELSGISWYEFFKVDILIKNGQNATQKLLPKIQELVNE